VRNGFLPSPNLWRVGFLETTTRWQHRGFHSRFSFHFNMRVSTRTCLLLLATLLLAAIVVHAFVPPPAFEHKAEVPPCCSIALACISLIGKRDADRFCMLAASLLLLCCVSAR
jgi:hypothetical protein